MRIFDAHIHYNKEAWEPYPPESVMELLDRTGVARALVSSTSDDGTLLLWEKAPGRIVPEMRPYRSKADIGSWTKDMTVLVYVEERLKRGIYVGIGEFHLDEPRVDDPVPRGFVELAVMHGLILHCHSNERVVEALVKMDKGVRILWAHAGVKASARTVENILDAYPNVWAELSYRPDVAPDGRLDPAWRALFLKHPDRFLVGTDTWVNSRWDEMPEVLEGVRAWLRQLPPDVAMKIAHGNGDRLFPP